MTKADPKFRSLPRDERRERIIWAAKHVMLEKGLDTASMDDVAAQAGTTKPTVYAHFKSKEELFQAVVEFVRGMFLGKLGSPEAYSDDPVEAISLFCGRFVEQMCWRDAIGYQRVAIAAFAQNPGVATAIHETLYVGATKTLAAYIKSRKLAKHPDAEAAFLLDTTTASPVIRRLYGIETPSDHHPGDKPVGGHADLKQIRRVVKLVASTWNQRG